jgi:hypothetical protein
MGLDMYLEAENYVGGWEHVPPEERRLYGEILDLAGLRALACKDSPSVDVTVKVAYWRKANAIHAWFVEHVQDGKDECQRSYVTRDQLAELVKLCQAVLDSVETVEGNVSNGTTYHPDGRVVRETRPGLVVAQKGIAAKQLPTKSGFFFGCTDYDEDYLADLRDTIKQLTPLLDPGLHGRFTFYYRASW